jgi:hypothetical protein
MAGLSACHSAMSIAAAVAPLAFGCKLAPRGVNCDAMWRQSEGLPLIIIDAAADMYACTDPH